MCALVAVQVCRIRQIGYPVRKSFEEFVFRYRCLALGSGGDHRALLSALAAKGLAKHGQWQIGHSKVTNALADLIFSPLPLNSHSL